MTDNKSFDKRVEYKLEKGLSFQKAVFETHNQEVSEIMGKLMTDNTVNSVDKAAKNYAEEVNEGENTPIKLYLSDLYDRSIRDFTAGAEWQSKQQSIPIQKEFKTDSVTVILPDNK